MRVTDEAEPPGEFVLRAVRVTPTTITVDWDEPVNTGPPLSTYFVRLTQHEQGITRDVGVPAGNARTFKYYLLTPNTEYGIIVRAESDEGSGSSNLVRVTTPPLRVPTFGDTTIPDQIYVAQRLRRPKTLPEATGGNGALTYTLTGPNGETVSEALPGLSFDPTTRILGGKPDINAITPATTYTYTAMDADDNTGTDDIATLEFSITVDADNHPRFTHQQPGMAFLVNEFDRRALPEATGGNGALIYQLAGEVRLPPGLTYDGTVRPPTISGTPTALFAKALFAYAVGDTDIDDSERDIDVQRFTIAVVNVFPEFFETVADQRLSENAFFHLALPDAGSGIRPRTFTLTGPNGEPVSEAVPGLNFEPSLRFLSGRPTTVATTTLVYIVTDANGATDTVFFRTIVAPRVALDALDAPDAQTYTMDTAIPALTLPAGSRGTTPLTYTLRVGPFEHDDVDGTDNAVPGLLFDRAARTLTGTPTEATDGAVTLIYVARDINNGTAPLTFDITVAEAVMVEALDDQTYTMGTEIPDLTLPVATGGTGDLTYILTGPNGTDLSELPAGLLWTGGITNPGAITGTPTAAGATELTYTVTDRNGSTASETFTVTVAEAVMVEATGDQFYTMGTEIPALTLPAATGGTGTLTYNLTGPNGTDLSELPVGLMWTGDTTNPGTIIGTPTAITTSPVTLTYTATDENGSTDSETFTVTVAAAVALTDTGDQTYTMGTEIPDLTLPMATDGTGTLTYTLRDGDGNDVDAVDNAVPGLTFNTTTRVLSGTPTTAAITALTYIATDDNGSTATDTFTVTVAAAVALADTGDQTYTMGTTITDLTLPLATGGTGTLTYTLRDGTGNDVDTTDNAVPGLTFTTTTRVLTGTPTTAATTPLTYTVTDQNGSTASATFDITVAAQVAVNAPNDQTYTMGRPITALTLPPATGGTGTLTYTLTGLNGTDLSELPAGLMWTGDATNPGTIIGEPTAITTSPVTLTYTATDENDSTDSETFTLTVAAQVAVTAPDDQTYTMGQTITDLTLPAASGGTGTLTYTLRDGSGNDVDNTDNAVPGLTFNTTSRVLSGTPTTAATTALTYTVTDERGSTASDTVTLTVAAAVALTDTGDQTYTMGRPIPALTLPAAIGGTGTLTYTLTGPASAALSQVVPGLTFNTTSRVLSGTPTTAATTALTYTVTDERGSTASATLTLTVAAQVAVTAPNDQTYTMGTMIPALTLPAATGGTGTLTYTLTGPGDAALSVAVPGLTFNTTARTLTGTPTTAATTALTYTVTDENGSTASETFTVTVAAQVAVMAPTDQTYTMGRPRSLPLTLPMATGGTGTLTYTLTGTANGNDVDGTDNAVPGLTFTATTRVLSGTPTTAATTALTYTVTDQNGSTASDTFDPHRGGRRWP